MNRQQMTHVLAFGASLVLVAVLIGCVKSPSSDESSGASGQQDTQLTSSGNSNSPDADQANSKSNAGKDRPLWETVPREVVSEVTGITYSDTSDKTDYPNIKHCEYRHQSLAVSMTLALGSTSKTRMENNRLVETQPVSGFVGEALWEPAQGKLSVLDGDHCVEVVVSQDHGEERRRIELSKQIAKKVLEQY